MYTCVHVKFIWNFRIYTCTRRIIFPRNSIWNLLLGKTIFSSRSWHSFIKNYFISWKKEFTYERNGLRQAQERPKHKMNFKDSLNIQNQCVCIQFIAWRKCEWIMVHDECHVLPHSLQQFSFEQSLWWWVRCTYKFHIMLIKK